MQQDRDLGRMDPRKLPLKAQWAAAGMAVASIVVSACGGGDSKPVKTPEVVGTTGAINTPTAEATIRPTEAPTIIPTATAEVKVLTPDELAAEIDKAYAGREFDQNGVADDTRTAAGLKRVLNICASDPTPDTNDVRLAISSCAILGESTKQLHTLIPGDEQFWTLNQLIKPYFVARLNALKKIAPHPIDPSYESDVIRRDFTK